MTLLGDEAKERIVEECNPELKHFERSDIFAVKDLEECYAYEEKIGTDDFVWFISPIYSFGPSNNASKSYYKEKERMGDGFIE